MEKTIKTARAFWGDRGVCKLPNYQKCIKFLIKMLWQGLICVRKKSQHNIIKATSNGRRMENGESSLPVGGAIRIRFFFFPILTKY